MYKSSGQVNKYVAENRPGFTAFRLPCCKLGDDFQRRGEVAGPVVSARVTKMVLVGSVVNQGLTGA
jgi:hypothetical protein